MSEKKESIAYTLVIDKDRSKILNAMMAATTLLLPRLLKARPDIDIKELVKFFTIIADKTHENDWCPDKGISRCMRHKK